MGEQASLLIVDDDPAVTELLSLVLGKAGYRCVVAHSGQQALAMAAPHAPAAALLDIAMPGMDGITLLERMKAAQPDMATVMVTANGSAQAAMEAVRRGADDYIVKPFQDEALVWSVQRALRMRQLEVENRQYRDDLERKVRDRTRELAERIRAERGLFLGAIESLCAALEAKDAGTQGHSRRVADYAALAAREMCLAEEDVGQVRLAGLLHDVGKIGVPEALLNRPEALSEDEYARVMAHAETGADILATIPGLAPVAVWIRHHHEQYDGRGHPDGLAGTDIPLPSRIIAVADAYDAMTSSRPYREALSESQARRELAAQRGRHWDPVAVDRFLSALRGAPTDSVDGGTQGHEHHAER
ncbi:MAG: HD domain-containing phosphohydrolase [Armatimonadota bacterium]